MRLVTLTLTPSRKIRALMVNQTAARRIPLSFRLRTLIILVSIVCAALSWLGIEYRRARHENQLIAAAIRTGGEVYYDQAIWPYAESDGSDGYFRQRLRRIAGNSLFGRVKDVRFGPSTLLADLRQLSKAHSVRAIGFNRMNVTSDHITELSHIDGWSRLYLFKCNIDSDAYASIGRLTQLRSLWIVPPTMSAPPLEFLKNLTNLEDLLIDAAFVDLCEVSRLVPVLNIKSMRLAASSFANGLTCIHKFENLRNLSLEATGISGKDLPDLATLQLLERLWLNDTNIGDEDLAPLEKLQRLKSLDLSRTRVTPQGVERLEAALPGCHVYTEEVSN